MARLILDWNAQEISWDERAFWLRILEGAAWAAEEENRTAWHKVDRTSDLETLKRRTAFVEVTRAAHDSIRREFSKFFSVCDKQLTYDLGLRVLWKKFSEIAGSCGLKLSKDKLRYESLIRELISDGCSRQSAFHLIQGNQRIGVLQPCLSKGKDERIKVSVFPRQEDWTSLETRSSEEYKLCFHLQCELKRAGFSLWNELEPPHEPEIEGDGAVRMIETAGSR
jgi:hypothetical protein